MSTAIRVARAADATALRELDVRVWSTDVTPTSRSELAKPFFSAASGPQDVLVAEHGGALAGYVKVAAPTPLVAGSHVLEIRGLAVDPAHRRRGVGLALLRAVEREARRRGVTRVTLRVLAPNVPARRLYESAGYAVEGVLHGEFVLGGRYVDDVLMALAVPPEGSPSTG